MPVNIAARKLIRPDILTEVLSFNDRSFLKYKGMAGRIFSATL
jgi:hypothetical protein